MSYQANGITNPVGSLPPTMSVPQPFGALSNSSNQSFYVESMPKGWNFVNILLVLLLVCSCITSIVNLTNGQIGGAVCTLCCLCIFYWIYASYNSLSPMLVVPSQ